MLFVSYGTWLLLTTLVYINFFEEYQSKPWYTYWQHNRPSLLTENIFLNIMCRIPFSFVSDIPFSFALANQDVCTSDLRSFIVWKKLYVYASRKDRRRKILHQYFYIQYFYILYSEVAWVINLRNILPSRWALCIVECTCIIATCINISTMHK